MRLKSKPNIRFAGQITGVEGYVEKRSHGDGRRPHGGRGTLWSQLASAGARLPVVVL